MSFAVLARKPEPASRSRAPSVTQRAAGGLRIGEPNDAFERDADRVADEVMAGDAIGLGESLSPVAMGRPPQGECACSGSCDGCKKRFVQRQIAGGGETGYAPRVVSEIVNSLGSPLDNASKTFFGARFGFDFSNIRIHADDKAAESAAAVGARAYTVGEHIVFGNGQYKPHSNEGRRLLSHELAHTIQQRGVVQQRGTANGLAPQTPALRQATGPTANPTLEPRSDAGLNDNRPAGRICPTVDLRVQLAPDQYDKLSIPQLRKLAVTDKAAADALRTRFEHMSDTELQRFRSDPMAHSVLAQRNITPADAAGQGNFSNPSMQDKLRQDIEQQRLHREAAGGEPRRAPNAVTPGGRTEGGTMGSARTDIPGLENQSFIGRSPKAGGQVNPNSQFAPPTDPKTLPQTHGHAEQDIADQLGSVLRSVPKAQLQGRHVWILIEEQPCSTCAQGSSNLATKAGVLRRLSEAFPGVTFEVKDLDSSQLIVLKAAPPATAGAPPAAATQAAAKPGAKPPAVAPSAEHEGTEPAGAPHVPGAKGASGDPTPALENEPGPVPQATRPSRAATPSHGPLDAEPVHDPAQAAPLPKPPGVRIAPTQPPAGEPELHAEAPTGLAPRSTGPAVGRGTEPEFDGAGMAAAAGVEFIGAIAEIFIRQWMIGHYAKEVEESNEKQIRDKLTAEKSRFDALIKDDQAQIQSWQAAGKEVSVEVSLLLVYQGTDIGNIIINVELQDVKVSATGVPGPTLKRFEPSLGGDILRGIFNPAGELVNYVAKLPLTRPKPAAAAQPALKPAENRTVPPRPVPGTHATPKDVHFPSAPGGFPSVREQQGAHCPSGNCHDEIRSDHLHGMLEQSGALRPDGKITDEDRKRFEDWFKNPPK